MSRDVGPYRMIRFSGPGATRAPQRHGACSDMLKKTMFVAALVLAGCGDAGQKAAKLPAEAAAEPAE